MFVCEQANSQYASTSEVNSSNVSTMAAHNLAGSSLAHQHHQQSPSHTVHISSNPDESLKELFSRSLSNSMQMHTSNHLNNRINNHHQNCSQNSQQNNNLLGNQQQHSPTSASGGSLPPRLSQRNLPASFFTPPSQCSSASHSRESSLDAGTILQQQPLPLHSPSRVNSKPPTPISALHSSPSPLSSSPASPPSTVGQMNNVQQQQQQTILLLNNNGHQSPSPGSVAGKRLNVMHSRARSLPVTLKNGQQQQQVFSLPPLHNSVQANLATRQQVQLTNTSPKNTGGVQSSVATSPQLKSVASQHYRQHSYDIDKLQLPEGWSMSFTATGERYFLNHKDKSTTWEDPRKELLRRELAAANSSNSMLGRQLLPNYSHTSASGQQQQNLHQQQQLAMSNSPASVSGSSAAYPLEFTADLPLPEGWVQARTVTSVPGGTSGEVVSVVYYVNLKEQTTSWYHPSVQRGLQLKTVTLKQQSSGSLEPPTFLATLQQLQLQQQQQQANMSNNNIPSDLLSALENMTTESNCSPNEHQLLQQLQQQQHQQQANMMNSSSSGGQSILRDLQLERERMRQRQGEILQSPQLMKSGVNSNNGNSFLSTSSPSAAFTHPNSDPFLSSAALGVSPHNQQRLANSNSIFASPVHNRQASLDSGLGGSVVMMMGSGGQQLGCHLGGQTNLFGSEQNLNLPNSGHHHQPQAHQQQNQLQENAQQHLFINHSQQHSSPAAMAVRGAVDDQMMLMADPQGQFTTTGDDNNSGNGGNIDDLAFIDSIDLMPSLDMDILSDMEELLSTPNRDNIMTWL